MSEASSLTAQTLSACLGPLHPLGLGPCNQRLAAVLAIIAPQRGQGDAVLLIERSVHPADPHSGQLALPGGRYEIDDKDLLQTALRETREEVGIDVAGQQVTGTLRLVDTTTGYQVLPYVARLAHTVSLRPSADEVADAFWLPIDWLSAPGHRQWQDYQHANMPEPVRLPFYDLNDGRRLWGATAVMLTDLIDRLKK